MSVTECCVHATLSPSLHGCQGQEPQVVCRDMVRHKKISTEEGTMMRTLLFMPGGLELHIGVSLSNGHVLALHLCSAIPRRV